MSISIKIHFSIYFEFRFFFSPRSNCHMSFFDNIMTTNPTNFYYQQYHPSQSSSLLQQPTTDNTDFNKLDKDLIYTYENRIVFLLF